MIEQISWSEFLVMEDTNTFNTRLDYLQSKWMLPYYKYSEFQWNYFTHKNNDKTITGCEVILVTTNKDKNWNYDHFDNAYHYILMKYSYDNIDKFINDSFLISTDKYDSIKWIFKTNIIAFIFFSIFFGWASYILYANHKEYLFLILLIWAFSFIGNYFYWKSKNIKTWNKYFDNKYDIRYVWELDENDGIKSNIKNYITPYFIEKYNNLMSIESFSNYDNGVLFDWNDIYFKMHVNHKNIMAVMPSNYLNANAKDRWGNHKEVIKAINKIEEFIN